MAYLGNFDSSAVEPSDFSALPAGTYSVLISGSEFRNTKSGDGQYLVLTMQVIDGPKKGRLLWHNLNLQNPSQQAVEIAQRDLSAICRATGKIAISDSEELHNIPFKITVSFEPEKPDGKGGMWPEKNRIKKFSPMNEGAPAPVAAPARPATAPKATPARTAAPKAAPAPAAVANKPWGAPKATPVPELETAGVEDDDVPF